MAKHGLFIVAAAFIVMSSLTFEEASALKCWRCNSGASNTAFCNDPFDATIITEQQRQFSYVDCGPNPFQNQNQNAYGQQMSMPKWVCKKTEQIVQGRTLISRSCATEEANGQRDACQEPNGPSYIKTQFCETCSTDGCNGAAQYGPSAAIFVVLSVIVAKMLA